MGYADIDFHQLLLPQPITHRFDLSASLAGLAETKRFNRQQDEIERRNLAQEGQNAAALDETRQGRLADTAVKQQEFAAKRQLLVADAIREHSSLIQKGRHEDAARIAQALGVLVPSGRQLPQGINAVPQWHPTAETETAAEDVAPDSEPMEAQTLPAPIGGLPPQGKPSEEDLAGQADKALTVGITGLAPKPRPPRSLDELMIGEAPPSLKIGEIVGDEASARADTGIADPMAETPEMARARKIADPMAETPEMARARKQNQYDPAVGRAPRWEGGAAEDRLPGNLSTLTAFARSLGASVGMNQDEIDAFQDQAISLMEGGAKSGIDPFEVQKELRAQAENWQRRQTTEYGIDTRAETAANALAAKAKGKGGGGAMNGLGQKERAQIIAWKNSEKSLQNFARVKTDEYGARSALERLTKEPTLFDDRVALAEIMHKYFGSAQTVSERATLEGAGGWENRLAQAINNVESGDLTNTMREGILKTLRDTSEQAHRVRTDRQALIKSSADGLFAGNPRMIAAAYSQFGLTSEGAPLDSGDGGAKAPASKPAAAGAPKPKTDAAKFGGRTL